MAFDNKAALIVETTDFLRSRGSDASVLQTNSIQHLDHEVLQGYQTAYQQILDKDYFGNFWCASCNYDMISRVWAAVRDQQPELFAEIEGATASVVELPAPEQPEAATNEGDKGKQPAKGKK